MTWLPVSFAGLLSRLLGSSNPAREASALTGGGYGHAAPMFRTQRGAGPLLSERDRLAKEAAKARSQHRPVKPIYSAARRITHGILSRGVR